MARIASLRGWPVIVLVRLVTLAACSDSSVTPQLPPQPSLDSFRGTMATLPAGYLVAGEDGGGVAVGEGFNPFTGVSDLQGDPRGSFDGFGAFTNGGASYSFGMRERGEADLRQARLFLRYVNTATKHVIGFDVAFGVEVWLRGERANRIRLKFNTGADGFDGLPDIVSVDNPRGRAEGGAIGELVDGTLAENRTEVRVRVLLSELGDGEGRVIGSLAPGDTGYFRWQYSNADGDRGALRSALAVSGVRVAPILGSPPSEATGSPLQFSHTAGFYTKAFQLSLSSSLTGATIFYTVDGSEPDSARVITNSEWERLPVGERERTLVYTGPIDLGKLAARPYEIASIPTTTGSGGDGDWWEPQGPGYRGTVIRARAIGKGRDSGVQTRSYFIAPEGRRRFSLPVLSLATGNAGLFGAATGIYVPGVSGANYDQRGAEWERPAHVEYFEVDGSRAVAQDAGVRIHGAYTREVPRKSLRLYARSEYGESRFRHRFFASKEEDEFKRLLVRNGGNDHNNALLRDAALQTLVQHLPFETQHYQPVILFINGEYWGIHDLRDRLDDHHLSIRHGIGREEIVLVKDGSDLQAGDPADLARWQEFNDRAGAGALRTRAEFEAEMDVDGYLDYAIAEMYAGNYDWPFNNIMHWRYKGGAPGGGGDPALDGRWRWLMYDVDFSFGLYESKEVDMVAHLLREGAGHWSRHLFRGLMGVPEIRAEFLQRAAVHLETTFHPDRVRAHVDSLARLLEPEIEEHTRRWRRPATKADWEINVQRMRDFAAERPDRFREHLRAGFAEVTGLAPLTIAGVTPGDGLTLHTVPLTAGAPGGFRRNRMWTGRLFTGIPVVLRAASLDLRAAQVSGRVSEVRRAAGELSFIMEGPVRVTLR
jgi:hypothetical protein